MENDTHRSGLGAPPRETGIVRAATLFYAGMALLALAIAALRGASPIVAPGRAAAEIDWLLHPLLGALAAAVVIGVSVALSSATRWGAALERELGLVLGPLSVRSCLLLAGASGVAEELLFRGALQPWLGYVAASVLFGLAHFVPRRALLPWTAFTLVAGFGLGALYEATGNVVAPVVAHAVVNAVNLRRISRSCFPDT